MMIKLGRILVHDLLRKIHRVLPLRRRHIRLIVLQFRRVRLRLVRKQVHDSAFARRALVDSEAGAEVAVGADLDGFEELDGEVLAVVADEIVGWASSAPGGRKGLLVFVAWEVVVYCLHVVDGHAAGLDKCLVVESCLADFEKMPVFSIQLLVDVDDIEVLVLPLQR
jgi:hypothetical protein